MKDYTVIRDIWRKGILQPVGTVLRLAEAEAKYLAHALEEKAVEVETKVEAAVKQVRAPKAPLTASVTEAPADGSVN
jgi:hypothetical protein